MATLNKMKRNITMFLFAISNTEIRNVANYLNIFLLIYFR